MMARTGEFLCKIFNTVNPDLEVNKRARRFKHLLLSLLLPAVFISGLAQAEPVIWTGLVNTSASGNTLTKTGGGTKWNAEGISQQVINGDGWVEFTLTSIGTCHAAGLSYVNNGTTWGSIDYTIMFCANDKAKIYEAGTYRGTFDPYQVGDVFRVERTGNTITYLKNGSVFYTSTVPTVDGSTLFLDTSLHTPGVQVANAIILQ